ncbi:hypothetical protein JQ615_09630 [Bradyrhizobium jicamae]|uniref:Uncharacterized protein n=1 Tax=Bradyrhizobium jicamae TaxID=280332 RepID=A0ABS5FFT2_9BRAD|nr:hypothetical protein [Bradyrhizobium jicamae]MBR0795647.1 hypothetical protein [Bradyrhizobium jicamae]
MTNDKVKKLKAKQMKKKGLKQRALKKAVTIGMDEESMTECLDIIRQYRGKYRSFRQRFLDLKNANRITKVRILREFVTKLEEMESEARSAALKLKARLPPHKPLTQSNLQAYLADRTVREA